MNPRLSNGLWITAGIATLMWVAYSMGVNSASREAYAREVEQEKQSKREKWEVKWIAGAMTRVETNSGRTQVFAPAQNEWREIGKTPFQLAADEFNKEMESALKKQASEPEAEPAPPPRSWFREHMEWVVCGGLFILAALGILLSELRRGRNPPITNQAPVKWPGPEGRF